MSHTPWRFVVTSEAYPAFSTSTSPAIEQAVREGLAPSTVILNIFDADGITIGVNEDPTQVLDLDFCRAKGIQTMRRVNGGGAVYAGAGSAFLVLFLRPEDMPNPAAMPMTATTAFPQILTAMAEVIESRFGIPARYRPLNDVEVEGRKLMPTSLKIEDGVMTFRLVLNVTGIDTALAGPAMPMAPEKVRDKVHKTLETRFTYLEKEIGRPVAQAELEGLAHDLCAHAFDVHSLTPGTLSAVERGYAADFYKRLSQDAWFFGKALTSRLPEGLGAGDSIGHGREKSPGGLIWATLVVRDGTIRHAVLNGDWHPRPLHSTDWFEAELAGVPADEAAIRAHVEAFLARDGVEWAGVEADHLMAALGKALAEATA
jgi:lipoate-protein ligase A